MNILYDLNRIGIYVYLYKHSKLGTVSTEFSIYDAGGFTEIYLPGLDSRTRFRGTISDCLVQLHQHIEHNVKPGVNRFAVLKVDTEPNVLTVDLTLLIER